MIRNEVEYQNAPARLKEEHTRLAERTETTERDRRRVPQATGSDFIYLWVTFRLAPIAR